MKRVIEFPPVEAATEEGLVAVGGDLEIDTIMAAYRQGIFPWPVSVDLPLAWFSPDPRGLIDFDELHLSKSFEKFLKKTNYHVSFNQDFNKVIKECARIYRKGQPGTWITPQMISGYQKLFQAGHAYSVEVWSEKEMIAGLYGVTMGDFISGESMYTIQDNGSKFALYSLIKLLQSKGVRWMDTQMVTPAVEQFGGKYISRPDFIERLLKTDWTKKRSDIF